MAEACQFYVEKDLANIEHFLRNKSHTFNFDLAGGKEEFGRFVEWLDRDCSQESNDA